MSKKTAVRVSKNKPKNAYKLLFNGKINANIVGQNAVENVIDISIDAGTIICNLGNESYSPDRKDLILIKKEMQKLGEILGIKKSNCIIVNTGLVR